MIKINFKNTPQSFSSIKEKLNKIKNKKRPDFALYKENLVYLVEKLKPYMKYKNIILIGNGGSNTSLNAFYTALNTKKNISILTTTEPDIINNLKKKFSKKDTLILAISKSGTTIGVIECLLSFRNYKILAITGRLSPLEEISKKMNFEVIAHPNIGGRYSGLTSCAIIPALLCKIDVSKIIASAKRTYAKCAPQNKISNNPALKLAANLYLLEKKKYTEIIIPIYETKLLGFKNLITQLMHESVCKNKKGQTILCLDGPEWQHHTSQRFFGGKNNCIGLFIKTINQQDTKSKITIPKNLQNIELRNGSLKDLNGNLYADTLAYEFEGVYTHALKDKKPTITILINKLIPESVGELLALWQYTAVYSAWLRNVDPFNQPEVELAKEISFQLRKKH